MPFPLIAALVGAGASLLAARRSAKAAKSAASTISAAEAQNRALAERSTRESMTDFDAALEGALRALGGSSDIASGYQQPFYDTGMDSLSQLADILGINGPEAAAAARERFQTSPGYQFQLDEGVRAIDRSAAARGGLYSGQTGRDLMTFGTGLANQEFNNYLSRLAELAGSGQGAAGTLSQIASGFGSNAANTLLGTAANKANTRTGGMNAITGFNSNAASATAQGTAGGAGAWNQGLSNVAQLLAYGGGQGFTTPLLDRWRANRAA